MNTGIWEKEIIVKHKILRVNNITYVLLENDTFKTDENNLSTDPKFVIGSVEAPDCVFIGKPIIACDNTDVTNSFYFKYFYLYLLKEDVSGKEEIEVYYDLSGYDSNDEIHYYLSTKSGALRIKL